MSRQKSKGRQRSNTVRFGISIDSRLLAKFDEMIAQKGYANRSEALRDLMRDRLVERSWAARGENVVGTVTMIYSHESRELTKRLTELQHKNLVHIISSLHVHLDAHHCMEVLVVKGKSEKVSRISDQLIGTKGVKHGKLVMSTTGDRLY